MRKGKIKIEKKKRRKENETRVAEELKNARLL